MTIPYLESLRVENLVLIECAELDLHPGLNIITGETGAGKTVLTKAFDLLLGARAPKKVIRPGATEAYIEGRFSLPSDWLRRYQGTPIEDIIDLNARHLVLARRVTIAGRSASLVDGRTVSLEMLGKLSQELLSFYGQHEQRSLMLEHVQAHLLDRAGDGKGRSFRISYQKARSDALAATRVASQAALQLETDERELALARFEYDELVGAELLAGEEEELLAELKRLEQAEEGQQACHEAYGFFSGEAIDAPGVQGLLGQIDQALAALEGDDIYEVRARVEALRVETDDLTSEVGAIAQAWIADPERQQLITGRLDLIHRLTRKHGVPYSGLFERQHQLQELIETADALPRKVERLEAEAEKLLADTAAHAESLSAWRVAQAPKLSRAVTKTLKELAFDGATFSIALGAHSGMGLARYGEEGAERIAFTFQSGPGMHADELAAIASGGEMSRIMLALTSHCTAGETGTLVLDEPDAGIGGNTAHGVGNRLKALGAHRQILVVSHLPQVASRADRHFYLAKHAKKGSTHTSISHLERMDEIIDELCRMGGHDPKEPAARKIATSLRVG